MTSQINLFVVAKTTGGFAREDAEQAHVVGVFTDEVVAKKIASVTHASVHPITQNFIAPGYIETLKAFGIDADALLERIKSE